MKINNHRTAKDLLHSISLREKCPCSEFFWSAFSRIRTEYEGILRISPYSVQTREKAEQKNSEYGHFSRSVGHFYIYAKLMKHINPLTVNGECCPHIETNQLTCSPNDGTIGRQWVLTS